MSRRWLGRWAVAGALVVVAVVVGAVAGARVASAHAQLLEITPAYDEVVPTAPSEVTMRFSEQVSLIGGSVRVLDDTAELVSSAPVVQGPVITVPLRAGLRDGTYTVTYAVISADTHRVSGASIFHIGAPSSGTPVVAAPSDDVAWGLRLGAVGLSVLGYAGALISGGLVVLVTRERRARPARTEPDGPSAAHHPGPVDADDFVLLLRRWEFVARRAAVLAAAALISSVPFRIARVGGGLSALRDDAFISATLRGPLGVSIAVTVVALVALTAALASGAASALCLALSAAALVGFTLEGHSRAVGPRPVMIGADVVHLAAGAIWLGGIVGLVIAFRSRTAAARLAPVVARFSTTAVAAVLAVTAAGVAMAWYILPTLGDLTSTGWGLALLVKVAIVAVVVALGGYNRRYLVPSVGDDAGRGDTARRRLGRIVRIEALGLLAVVAVTGVLVTRSPVPATAIAPPTATATTQHADLDLQSGAGHVEITVTPATIGPNEIAISITGPDGTALQVVEDPTIELRQTDLQIGPLQPTMTQTGDGAYTADIDLSYPGEWRLDIHARPSEFESVAGSTTITIGGG